MRAVTEACFALVREYKGSHSGEHGDGIVRSEFLEPMYGAPIMRAFEAVKAAFDPDGMFNPNRIVRPPRMDDRSLFRYKPGYAPIDGLAPRLDWSAHPGSLLGAAEMCNNNGACRGFDAGVMCPSYRVTRDEAHVTRGRANTLRLALTGQLPGGLASDAVAKAMALCVSCKACRRECPTGVDMARMKIEALAARVERHGPGIRQRLVAGLPRYAPYAAWAAPVANMVGRSRTLRRAVGLAAARSLPAWRRDAFHDGEAAGAAGTRTVLLFADTFSRFHEPENLRAALRVLAAAGYRAVMPRAAGRPLCCGRTYLSAGLVGRARAEAARTLAALAGDLPVIGLEPSCLLTLRDEFPALLPGAAADALAARALLLSEFLAREQPSLPLRPLPVVAHVHGHCHQKSFGAFPAALSMLRLVPELTVRPIASSCCGMAGAFGYQAETQDVSRAMAERDLLPAVRAAAPDDVIVADGTSCRHQIADLADRRAVHGVTVLAGQLVATKSLGTPT
jgi:Fe-S oxidoreductase